MHRGSVRLPLALTLALLVLPGRADADIPPIDPPVRPESTAATGPVRPPMGNHAVPAVLAALGVAGLGLWFLRRRTGNNSTAQPGNTDKR